MHSDEVPINGSIPETTGESGDVLVFMPHGGEEEEQQTLSPEETAGILKKLKSEGINVESGLKHTSDKTDFYLELLGDYCTVQPEKLRILQDAFEREDWHSYQIMIHSLKSTSRTIGAEGVAKTAEKLEEAASVSDGVYVKKKHPAFVRQYEDQVRIIKDCIK